VPFPRLACREGCSPLLFPAISRPPRDAAGHDHARFDYPFLPALKKSQHICSGLRNPSSRVYRYGLFRLGRCREPQLEKGSVSARAETGRFSTGAGQLAKFAFRLRFRFPGASAITSKPASMRRS
jgi:hypothetical protein